MTTLPTSDDEQAFGQWWRHYQERLEQAGESHVEVYVRACAPPPGTHADRTRFFETLADVTDDVLDSYSLTILGDEICVCTDCRRLVEHRQLLDTVSQLRSWEDEDLRASGFVERETDSAVTNECHTVVTPPELAVGAYLDDELAGVFPCRGDGSRYTPATFLRALVHGHTEPGDNTDLQLLRSSSG